MTEIPKPAVTEKDTKSNNSFRWGFFSGLSLLEQNPVPLPNATEAKKEALERLVDLSRGFPQIGLSDPAGRLRLTQTLAETSTAAKKTLTTKAPETIKQETLPPKHGRIRKLFGR